MSSANEPAVEVLTAEIRVLQVGSKPVTLSAAGSSTVLTRPRSSRSAGCASIRNRLMA
jgi:hypothetical protein